IQQNPKHAGMHLARIILEVSANKLDDALEAARQGLKVLPEDKDLSFALGEILAEKGSGAEVEPILTSLTEARYFLVRLDFLKARLHMLREEWSQAAQILQRVRSVTNPRPSLLFSWKAELLLGSCFEKLGSPDQALAVYQEGVKKD